MEIAISEPYFYGIHGGEESIPHFMVVYSYTLEEFYNNENYNNKIHLKEMGGKFSVFG